ncbi:MAG TPA: pyridoxamine 5'-phosphate oxidase family protein [Nocardioidaceae bacterium]|nr:pyridoxamine 5'-phosphate oxidase family protein [Nocardioidaceae bacterium]
MSIRALTNVEALHLLGSVELGRIAFTIDALPTIRTVNHIVDHGDVIVRGHRGVDVVLKAAAGEVIAYSADAIDPRTYEGWSVTLTGMAYLIENSAMLARYPEVVRPWGTHEEGYVLRIHPEIVTGIELLEEPEEIPVA